MGSNRLPVDDRIWKSAQRLESAQIIYGRSQTGMGDQQFDGAFELFEKSAREQWAAPPLVKRKPAHQILRSFRVERICTSPKPSAQLFQHLVGGNGCHRSRLDFDVSASGFFRPCSIGFTRRVEAGDQAIQQT